jgi:hypothetical protein
MRRLVAYCVLLFLATGSAMADEVAFYKAVIYPMALDQRNRHPREGYGSPEVQIALLTKRIDELTSHLKKHDKDKHSAAASSRWLQTAAPI